VFTSDYDHFSTSFGTEQPLQTEEAFQESVISISLFPDIEASYIMVYLTVL
jgi:hypothetical protein